MDVVITFVDGSDPQWCADYRQTLGGEPELAKRYRDWDMLRFLFRGIERYLPYVRQVFLVVSRDSQVPAWVDRKRIRVVLHEDFIPAEYLPTFCSCTIEMFLHRIPDLDERFVYFNDDIIPVRPCPEEDFFPEGRPAIGFSRHLAAQGLFKRICRNCDHLARKAAGVKAEFRFLRPQHGPGPMLRSVCEQAFRAVEQEIRATLAPVRKRNSLCQYFYTDFALLSGVALDRPQSKRHFSLAVSSLNRICRFLEKPDRSLVCINDVQMSEKRYRHCRSRLRTALERHFPQRSDYEL